MEQHDMRDLHQPIYGPSPFTLLLSEIRQAIDHQAYVLKSERANLANLWERVTDNSASEMLGLISEELRLMSKSMAADLAIADAERRASGRQKFADLKAEIDASIAAGLIGGADGFKLDSLIHRLARNLETY
jgi:hypothetical protein